MIDSTATASFISSNAARLLGVTRTHGGIPQVCGLSSSQVKTKGLTHVNIASLSGNMLSKEHPVIILDNITNNLPRVKISSEVKTHLHNFMLADPTFDTPAPVDCLIGADLFAQTLTGQQFSLGKNMPTVVNTIFGFVLIGAAPSDSGDSHSPQHGMITTLLCANDLDLHQSIQRFWLYEEPPHSV